MSQESTSSLLFELISNHDKLIPHEIKIIDSNLTLGDFKINFEYVNQNDPLCDVTITNIKISEIIQGKLPQMLKKLMVSRDWVKQSYNYNLDNLPSLLKMLKIININIQMDNLPTGLKVLEIVGIYEKSLDALPDSLELLKICSSYKQKLDDLPVGLKKLFILGSYSLPLKNLPIGLNTLIFTDKVNYQVTLPKNIKYVEFDESNNQIRRRFLKLYPKVIYNDKDYIDSSEGYGHDKTLSENKVEYYSDSDSSDDFESESDSDSSHRELNHELLINY